MILTLLLAGMVQWHDAPAQAVLPRHLITSMGGGGGWTTIYSGHEPLAARQLMSSAVRFASSYALGSRWSLGGHYDRIGSVLHPGEVERVRFTTYMLEGTYRPYLGTHATVEGTLAAGYSIMALFPEGRLLPHDARGAVFGIGLRYLHLLNNSVGAFVALDHAHSVPQRVSFHDAPVLEMPAGATHITWHSQRITGGMFVRF